MKDSAQHIRAVQLLVNAYEGRGVPKSFEVCEHELALAMKLVEPEDQMNEGHVAKLRAKGIREGK